MIGLSVRWSVFLVAPLSAWGPGAREGLTRRGTGCLGRGDTCREALRFWAGGRPSWSISMGSLGPSLGPLASVQGSPMGRGKEGWEIPLRGLSVALRVREGMGFCRGSESEQRPRSGGEEPRRGLGAVSALASVTYTCLLRCYNQGL